MRLLETVSVFLFTCATGSGADLVPFAPPWDDATPGPTNISGTLDKPAGKSGFVHVKDGHLYAGDHRLRLFGSNLTAGADFPDHETADKVAARMAKFGLNAVRFHFLDATWGTPRLINYESGDWRNWNADALDRLDYFIARLKEHGNLRRPEPARRPPLRRRRRRGCQGEPTRLEGRARRRLLPRAAHGGAEAVRPPVAHAPESLHETHLRRRPRGGAGRDQQRERPDPHLDGAAISMRCPTCSRRISRNNGTSGSPSDMPTRRRSPRPGARATNRWPRRCSPTPSWPGTWKAGTSSSTRARRSMRPSKTARPSCASANPAAAGWHVQFNQSKLAVKRGGVYTVSFRAAADRHRKVNLSLMQAHDPWGNLGLATSLALTKQPQPFTFTFIATDDDENARLNFGDMNQEGAEFRFGELSFKAGGRVGLGEGESLENRNIRVPKFAESRTLPAGGRQDWIRFLWETERKHWTGMRRFLKEELGVKVPIVGTIVATSTPNLMADMDVVDTHAYWQHPQFPGKPWDMNNWFVKNISMVDYPDERHGDAIGLPARGGQAAHGQRVQPPGAEHARRRRSALHCRLRRAAGLGRDFPLHLFARGQEHQSRLHSRVSSTSGSIPRSWPTFPSRRSSSAEAICAPRNSC